MTGPVFELRLGTKDVREDEGQYVTSFLWGCFWPDCCKPCEGNVTRRLEFYPWYKISLPLAALALSV